MLKSVKRKNIYIAVRPRRWFKLNNYGNNLFVLMPCVYKTQKTLAIKRKVIAIKSNTDRLKIKER